MSNAILNILFAAVLFIAAVFVFIRIALRIRKHCGSMATILLAATYDFMNKDKREAAEEVVQLKSEKTNEEYPADSNRS